MKNIGDDFYKSLMKDDKLHDINEEKINEVEVQSLEYLKKPQVTKEEDTTKDYLLEQIINMEKQISHLKQIVGRM